MARRIQPVAQSQFQVQIGDFGTTYFQTFSGITATRERTMVPSSNSRFKVPVFGLTEYDTVELTKPYEPTNGVDNRLIELFRQATDDTFTVTVRAVRNGEQEEQVGQTITLLRCVCTELQSPEIDRDGNDAAMLTLTLSFEDFRID